MHIADDGLIRDICQMPSPNCDERPADAQVELLVIHNISLPPGKFGGPGIIDLFTNQLDPAAHPYYAQIAGNRVSAHVLVRRDGVAIQFVSLAKRAWHAGVSTWCGRERCNDFSIGIELEGADDIPFAAVQYERLAQLTCALKVRFPIADIVGHADIAPGRKTDPGPCFDWPHYRSLITD